MSSDFAKCCVCISEYDLEEHIAVILTQCGHNVCKECAEQILKSDHKECPMCRIKFPLGTDTKYVPNRQIREQLEKERQFAKCPVHSEQLLEYYCKTDKSKICVDCHFADGDEGHKGHVVERIADLKVKIAAKKKVFEDAQNKWKGICEEGKSLLGKRRLEQTKNIQAFERITKLVVFESYLGVQTVYDDEERKIDERFGESSIIQEIDSKISEYQDLKNSDLEKMLQENPEDYTKRFERTDRKQCIEEITQNLVEAETRLMEPCINQNNVKISIEVPAHPTHLKLRGYLSFECENGCLQITAGEKLNKNISLNVSELESQVKSIKFIFDKFNFNDQDMLILNYLWARFQTQTHSLGLVYKQLKESVPKSKFEEHLIDFSRTLFSQSQGFQSIEFSFEKCDGSDRYVRLLTEKIIPESPNLTILKLSCEETDLTDETFIAFLKSTKSLSKDLEVFWFAIKEMSLDSELISSLPFQLPNLKEFNFKTLEVCPSFARNARAAWVSFLASSLASMESLRICHIETDYKKKKELCKLIEPLSKMTHLKTLKIDMSDVEAYQTRYDEIVVPLKAILPDPDSLTVNITIKPPSAQPASGGGLFSNTVVEAEPRATSGSLFSGLARPTSLFAETGTSGGLFSSSGTGTTRTTGGGGGGLFSNSSSGGSGGLFRSAPSDGSGSLFGHSSSGGGLFSDPGVRASSLFSDSPRPSNPGGGLFSNTSSSGGGLFGGSRTGGSGLFSGEARTSGGLFANSESGSTSGLFSGSRSPRSGGLFSSTNVVGGSLFRNG